MGCQIGIMAAFASRDQLPTEAVRLVGPKNEAKNISGTNAYSVVTPPVNPVGPVGEQASQSGNPDAA